MEQSAKEEVGEECGICLDALTNPVALPCRHQFCSECLNGWRSKHGTFEDDERDRKCPLCRERIPPTKEMITQLKFWRIRKSQLEAVGDFCSKGFMTAKSVVEKLEREIEYWTETIVMMTTTTTAWCFRMTSVKLLWQTIHRKFSIGSDHLQLTNSG